MENIVCARLRVCLCVGVYVCGCVRVSVHVVICNGVFAYVNIDSYEFQLFMDASPLFFLFMFVFDENVKKD